MWCTLNWNDLKNEYHFCFLYFWILFAFPPSGYSSSSNYKFHDESESFSTIQEIEPISSSALQEQMCAVYLNSEPITDCNSVQTPFKCAHCSKEYPSFLQFKRHVKIHSGFKSYVCDVCSKPFIQSIDLTRHKRIHTGERPYKCKLCDYSAVQSSHLIRHLQKKHNSV